MPMRQIGSDSKTWGTMPSNVSRVSVTNDQVLAVGDVCYLETEKKNSVYPLTPAQWQEVLDGDLTLVKSRIETQLPGTQALFVKISWDDAFLDERFLTVNLVGTKIETVVKVLTAATLEPITASVIFAIAISVAFVAIIITACVVFAFAAWKLINLPGGSLLVFLLVGAGLLLVLGVKFGFGGGKGVRIGRKLD